MIDRDVLYRDDILPEDCGRVHRIVASTGFFSDEERQIAVELVQERLEKGPRSGYHFLLAMKGPELAGYTCFGPIPGTRDRYDLYWIVVSDSLRRGGLGGRLLSRTEERILAMGGRRVYADTSSRPQYAPTRSFYEKCGYRREALLEDFYSEGDSKVIYVKRLG